MPVVSSPSASSPFKFNLQLHTTTTFQALDWLIAFFFSNLQTTAAMQFTTLMAVLATCSVVLTSPLSQQISAA
ncbi:hypothetical protein Pst134EA_005629 [Puccinia striiformis f. sp. tritici]|nr:hypothetical protein Pst134EA_005629 [Puccinia striiformis f. sp. tritici]KAH9462815.1 hypothetical protein Pst134EB_006692 [Puccinia striiformis f. sp. tritici]KAH9471748.1 hypothetical protein Pst134EA_005629 [Puccinia striiformis f. sp. tritici]